MPYLANIAAFRHCITLVCCVYCNFVLHCVTTDVLFSHFTNPVLHVILQLTQ